MRDGPRVSRRVFLADAGRGMIVVAMLAVGGCGSGAATPPPVHPRSGSAPRVAPGWYRVPIYQDSAYPRVSTYVVARAGEAVVVDASASWEPRQVLPLDPAASGPSLDPTSDGPGGEVDILLALEAIDMGWQNVAHVIITHKHFDHAGGVAAVLEAAPDARAYAGAADIPFIASPRPLTPVADGDVAGGLRIVATPGHTPGHIAVLDEVRRVLVAGDALNTVGGSFEVASGPLSALLPSTEDPGEALRSAAKLGSLRFDTLLVGHGEPILSGAAPLVRNLADD